MFLRLKLFGEKKKLAFLKIASLLLSVSSVQLTAGL
jgi:hypothetical protein